MNSQMKELLGSWQVEVSIPNQGTFPALLTFAADGGMIATESPHLFESTGHGQWVSRGPSEVGFTFVALFGSQEGKNMGKLKVIGTLNLDAQHDSWHGPFKIEGMDASGQLTFSDRGTFSLARMVVESLD